MNPAHHAQRRVGRLLAALLLCGGAAATAAELYVSPEGNDDDAGTREAPFRTLYRAREEIRTMNAGMTEDITVYLRGNVDGGYHFLDSTLRFDERDGGRNGHRVIFRNYENEGVVISGGRRVGNWEKVPGTSPQQWKASFSFDKKIRNMYVDYLPAIRSQGPEITHGEDWGTYADGPAGFKVQGAENLTLPNPRDVELYKEDVWMTQQFCVEDIMDPGPNAVLTMQQPLWRIALYKAACPAPGAKYIIENALEFCDAANEFYFDRPNDMLYYIPREGVDMTTAVVVVPLVQRLVLIEGASPSEKVENLTFRGIAFQHDAYGLQKVGDSHGYVGVQGIDAFLRPVATEQGQIDDARVYWYGHSQIQAAVEMLFADGIIIDQCRFEYLGGGGVNCMNDVHNCVINGNIFRWVGAYMVNIGHSEHGNLTETYPQELYRIPAENEYWVPCSHITVSNNLSKTTPWQFTHTPVMNAYYIHDCKWLHNDLAPTGWCTFSVGFGWGRDDQSEVIRDNEAKFNYFNGSMLWHGDGGAFYTLSDQRGLVCHQNVFDNKWTEGDLASPRSKLVQPWGLFAQGGQRWYKAYYPDAGSEHITYTDIVKFGGGPTAGTWCDLKHVSVDRAWYEETGNGVAICKKDGVSCSNINSFPEGQPPADAKAIMDQAGLESAYEHLYDAVDWRPGEPPSVPNRIESTRLHRSPVSMSISGGRRPVLILNSPHRRLVRVSLLDIRGRRCSVLPRVRAEAGSSRIPLALSGQSLAQGSYIVSVASPGGMSAVKAFVVR